MFQFNELQDVNRWFDISIDPKFCFFVCPYIWFRIWKSHPNLIKQNGNLELCVGKSKQKSKKVLSFFSIFCLIKIHGFLLSWSEILSGLICGYFILNELNRTLDSWITKILTQKTWVVSKLTRPNDKTLLVTHVN